MKKKESLYPYVCCKVGGIKDLNDKCNIYKGITKRGKLIWVFNGKCKNCPQAVIKKRKPRK